MGARGSVGPLTMANVAKLTFWGVRGSTPTVERDTWRYGGNTSCLELTVPEGRFILDCGTGLRMLGKHMRAENNGSPATADAACIDAQVLVTHYHWDHIQGMPFFHPFFETQNRFEFYSFRSEQLGRDSLRQVLEAQLASPYFPVDLAKMTADRRFHEITGGDSWDTHGVHVTAAWLHHPQGCLGYRLDTSVGSIVYATDNEPGVREFDNNLLKLADGADALIYDAQFSPEQLAAHRGWGHSTWLEGVKIARQAGVKNLFLFHHDPESTGQDVDGFLYAARQAFPSTWAAIEGMCITLGEQSARVSLPEARLGRRREIPLSATVSGQSENGMPFEEQATVRDVSLLGAYLSLTKRPQLQSELRVVIQTGGDSQPANRFVLRATVVRCEPSFRTNEYGVGVVFVEDPESDPLSD